ncbi:MAG: GntG family PLP-dependent aldolase, partial [Bacteroidetes bacterium]|nr:GntG family PLP-dependent aldolase [Bacteroidota bacterium]
TVLALETETAHLLGKEAAVFVPSGTMGNQIAVRIHTSPGDEVILEADAHIRHYEGGAAAGLSGVQLNCLGGHRGVLTALQVEGAIRAGHEWDPITRLVCLENTHNRAGGTIIPLDAIEDIGRLCRERGLAFHLDGARLWNASAATGIPESTYAAPFDTVNVCLSKGLGAPVGSVLVGSADHIRLARRARKAFGGGMRQAGLLAAAGLFAIRHHRTGLKTDHANARSLAEGLSAFRNVSVDPAGVETNIVMFDVTDGRTALETLGQLQSAGVRMVPFGPRRIRATTHRDVNEADIRTALDRAASVLDRV